MGDRADRLNQRRQDSAAEKSASQQAEPSEESQPESESTQQAEPAGSIKDQYNGIYMFLPEDLLEEFNIAADEADLARRRQSGKRVEKIRHFEPMVVQRGLEKIAEADDDELEEWASQFDPDQ